MALPNDLTNPKKFTSTYNQSFRDRDQFISPHASQPMYHYSNAYDPSHYDGFNPGGPPPAQQVAPTDYLPPIDQRQNMQQTAQRGPASPPRDLWKSGTKPLSGVYTNQPMSMPDPQDVVWSGTSSGAPNPTRVGYGGFTQYDSAAASRAMDDARSKYHIPGYQGFVRGEQFRHGETYGRVSRRCLDVPTSVPLEP